LAVNGEAELARTSLPASPDDPLDPWVSATAGRALAFARTLVRDQADAEDIVHDCYRRLLANADRYDLPNNGTKLLFKAITNACINHSRRRPPVVSLETIEDAVGPDRLALADRPEASPEHLAMSGELEAAIAEAMTHLPVTQRAIVQLRSLGHPTAEVAEMVGVSPAHARVLLHRARQTLADLLRPFIEDSVT
jgi:RNA polymerase sigma-70 factor (ECF subfamily)